MLKDTYLKREWHYVKLYTIFWFCYVVVNFIPFTVKCTNLDQTQRVDDCNHTSAILTIVNQLLQIVVIVIGFYILTTVLKTKQYMAFLDHQDKLLKQFISYFVLSFLIVIEGVVSYYETRIDAFYWLNSLIYLLEAFAVGFYLWGRNPEDCFTCYNRISTIKYSQFAGAPLTQGGRQVNLTESRRNTDLSDTSFTRSQHN